MPEKGKTWSYRDWLGSLISVGSGAYGLGKACHSIYHTAFPHLKTFFTTFNLHTYPYSIPVAGISNTPFYKDLASPLLLGLASIALLGVYTPKIVAGLKDMRRGDLIEYSARTGMLLCFALFSLCMLVTTMFDIGIASTEIHSGAIILGIITHSFGVAVPFLASCFSAFCAYSMWSDNTESCTD